MTKNNGGRDDRQADRQRGRLAARGAGGTDYAAAMVGVVWCERQGIGGLDRAGLLRGLVRRGSGIALTAHSIPELVKRWPAQVVGENPSVTMKEMMLDLVRAGGGAADKTDDPIEVDVVDIHHDIATAVRQVRTVSRVSAPAPRAGGVANRQRVLAVQRADRGVAP